MVVWCNFGTNLPAIFSRFLNELNFCDKGISIKGISKIDLRAIFYFHMKNFSKLLQFSLICSIIKGVFIVSQKMHIQCRIKPAASYF